jgi:hypothetical protein
MLQKYSTKAAFWHSGTLVLENAALVQSAI